MSFVHGKNTVVWVDNSAGTLTDISEHCDSADFGREADTAEVTTFGKDSKIYIPGLKDGTFSVEGPWNKTIDEHMDGILGKMVDIEYGPGGSAGGATDVKYKFEAICTNYNPPSSNSDAVKWSAEFQISDDVERTTWA